MTKRSTRDQKVHVPELPSLVGHTVRARPAAMPEVPTLPSLAVLALAIAASCSPSQSSMPQGLSFSVQTESRVEGSFADGADWIRFTSTVDDSGTHSDIIVTNQAGVVLKALDGRLVRLGSLDLAALDIFDEDDRLIAEPVAKAFYESTDADLIALVFRHIDTPTAELSEPLGALYVLSSAVESGVSGKQLATEGIEEAKACFATCCGTDCDCNSGNRCAWYDYWCNKCQRHDQCINYYQYQLGWSSWLAHLTCDGLLL